MHFLDSPHLIFANCCSIWTHFLNHADPAITFIDCYSYCVSTFTNVGRNFFHTSQKILSCRVCLRFIRWMPVGFPKMAVVPIRLQLVMWLLFRKGKSIKSTNFGMWGDDCGDDGKAWTGGDETEENYGRGWAISEHGYGGMMIQEAKLKLLSLLQCFQLGK